MEWLEVHIDTNHAGLEPLEIFLSANGVDGVVIDDEQDFQSFLENNHQYWDYVDEDLEASMKGKSRITFYLPADGDGFDQLAHLRTALQGFKDAHAGKYGTLLMTLENLIKMSKDKVRESVPSADEVEGYSAEDIEKMVTQIAIGAIKFQDLKNNTASGYIFDLDDFAKFDGKTGPYIQYAIARINSIINKAKDAHINEGTVNLTNKEERDLALKISQLNNVIMRAHSEKEPSIISEYVFALAQTFSTFYNVSSIMNAESPEAAASRLRLARMVRDILKLLLDLLGIEAPEVMLKKAGAQ